MPSPERKALPSPPAAAASLNAEPALPSPSPSSTRTMDRSISRGTAAAFFSSRLGTLKRKHVVTAANANATTTTTTSGGSGGGGGGGGSHVKDIVTWLETTATSAGASSSLSFSSSERRQPSTAFSFSTTASAAVTSLDPRGSSAAASVPPSGPACEGTSGSGTSASLGHGASLTFDSSAGREPERSPPQPPTPPTPPTVDGHDGHDGDGLSFVPELRINSLTGEEEYSLTLLHYRSFLHRPLARCLDAPPPDPRVTARRTRASAGGSGGSSSSRSDATGPRHAGDGHGGRARGQVPQSTSLQQLDRLMSDLARWFPLADFDGKKDEAAEVALSPSPLRVKKKRSSQAKAGAGDGEDNGEASGFWDGVRAYLRIDEEELDSAETTTAATPSSSAASSSAPDSSDAIDARQSSAPDAMPPAPLYTPPRPPTAIPPLLSPTPRLPHTPSVSFSSSCYSDSEDDGDDDAHAGRATPPSPLPPAPPPRLFTHSTSGYIEAASDGSSDASSQRHVSGSTVRAGVERDEGALRAAPRSASKGHGTWYCDSSESGSGSGSILIGLDSRDDAPSGRTGWLAGALRGKAARQEGSEHRRKPRSHFADIKADIDRLLAGSRR